MIQCAILLGGHGTRLGLTDRSKPLADLAGVPLFQRSVRTLADLRAEMDLLVVISNCPERDNPAAGFAPTPVRAIVYTPG